VERKRRLALIYFIGLAVEERTNVGSLLIFEAAPSDRELTAPNAKSAFSLGYN